MGVFVYNKSKEKYERAKVEHCPYCKGYGNNFGDDDVCHLCNGYGKLWVSIENTGWTCSFYGRQNRSKLY